MRIESFRRPAHSTHPSVILIVGSYQPELCGVAHYSQRLAALLTEIGVPTLIFTARSTYQASGAAATPDARKVVDAWRLGDLGQLAKAVANYNPSIVHIQHAPFSFGGSRAHLFIPQALRSHGLRQPVVTTVHEYGGWDVGRSLSGPLRTFIETTATVGERLGWGDRELLTLLPNSERVITTNGHHAQALSRVLGSRRHNRLVEIPIGPNIVPLPGAPAEHRRRVRARLAISEDAPVLAFFGFVHPVKGMEILIDAFARVRETHAGARLWIIGGFENLAFRGAEAEAFHRALLDRIVARGLRDSVDVTGFVEDVEVSARLFAADIAIFPFHRGATLKSGSLLAAFAHGCPVVTTPPMDGPSELRHGEEAYLVPPRDPDALADAVVRLLGDAALRQQLAAGGRARAALVSWLAIAHRHRQVYGEIAPELRVPRADPEQAA